MKLLNSISPNAAAQVAMSASRTSEAFDILGYPITDIDRNLARWIDEAIESQKAMDTVALSVETSSLLMLMRCLVMIGNDDAAWRIADSLARSDVKVGKYSLRDSVLASLTTIPSRREWIVRLAVLPGETKVTSKAEESIIRSVDGNSTTTWKLVMDTMNSIMPKRSFRDRLFAVYQLFAGEIPIEFNPDKDFQRIYDRVTINKAEGFQNRLMSQNESQIFRSLKDLFSMHGQVDLASKCTQQLMRRGELSAAIEIANRELEGGRLETAKNYFDFVWNQTASQSRISREARIGYDDVEWASKALVGKWKVARRTGDEQLIDELSEQLRLTLCTPSTDLRRTLAEELSNQSEVSLAAQAYDVLLAMTAMGSNEGTEFVYVASDFAMAFRESRPQEAAKWFDLAVSGTLESTDFRPVGYVTLPLSARRFLIEAAIETKDIESARRHVDRLLELDPVDIDFAERLLPRMREAEMNVLADETFDRVFENGKKHVERFAFDATTANNVAWVAAMNERRVEEARELVQRAVDLEPESAIYRDTLAEVLFQLGRKKEALQIEQASVIDDPGQWHLHQQIEKYREAVDAE